jgi:hypothetical protein
MSRPGAASCAAVPASNARAEASRRNGAKSRGPKTPEGKARSARNALKHGMRAHKYLVLPQEDAIEFAGLEAALLEELAPLGAMQTLLARRVVVAAWRLARADRLETELFGEEGYGNASPGLALIRDGNGTRSFETLLRYRGAAMAEFWRALRTLKALQAEAEVSLERCARAEPAHLAPPAPIEACPQPRRVEPQGPTACRGETVAYAMPKEPEPAGTLHEPGRRWHANRPAAPRIPNEPDSRRKPVEPQAVEPPAATGRRKQATQARPTQRPRGAPATWRSAGQAVDCGQG